MTMPNEIVVSEKNIPLVERYILRDDFPQRETIFRLGVAKEVFLIQAKIFNWPERETFHFPFSSQVSRTLRHKSILHPPALDDIIQSSKIKICFAPNGEHGLELQVSSKKNLLATLPCLEGFLDCCFVVNPNIVNLLNQLRETNDNFLLELKKILEEGFLNPGREFVLSNKSSLEESPRDLQNLIVSELFLKRGLPWSH